MKYFGFIILFLIGCSSVKKEERACSVPEDFLIQRVFVEGEEIIPNVPFLDDRPLQPPINFEIWFNDGKIGHMALQNLLVQGIRVDLTGVIGPPDFTYVLTWVSVAPPNGLFEDCATGPGIPFHLGCERWDYDRDGDIDQDDFAERQRFLVITGTSP